MKETKSVEILMSTYNGSKYVKDQIDSIFDQKNVNVHLSIRDDGSTDNTVEVIELLSEKYPGRISLHIGKNIGYRRSFLKLLSLAKKADYTGFADQDDYWKPNKLQVAIECLDRIQSSIKLYASSTENVDENLVITSVHSMSKVNPTLESAFTRIRYTGCTFLFSEKLREIASVFSDLKLPPDSMPSHDFIVVACALSCGEIYCDSNSYIYHIRRPNSVSTGGNGLVKRIRTEFHGVFQRKYTCSFTAKLLLERCRCYLTDEAVEYLTDVARCNQSVRNRLKLLTNKSMKSGIWICDIENKVKILIGRY